MYSKTFRFRRLLLSPAPARARPARLQQPTGYTPPEERNRMKRLARPAVLASAAGALAVAGVVALMTPASAATVPVPFDCQATPPVGAAQQLTLDTSMEADAPATVAPGDTFVVNLAPDAMAVPATAGGYTVNKLTNVTLKVPVPANSTYVSATLDGGSNIGTATPTVSEADNVVTVTVPGPLAGGSTVQLPALHMTLTASGDAGSSIQTTLAGTSYTDPGLTFTANVKVTFLNVDVPATCYGNPAPIFTTTTIQAPSDAPSA
jgi:dehydratase